MEAGDFGLDPGLGSHFRDGNRPSCTMRTIPRHLAVIVLLWSALASPQSFAQFNLPPAARGREVRGATAAPDSWIRAEVAGIEVLSTTAPKVITEMLDDLQSRARALELFWPARKEQPLAFAVFCANEKEYAVVNRSGRSRSAGSYSPASGTDRVPAMTINFSLGSDSGISVGDGMVQRFGTEVLKYQRLGFQQPSWVAEGLGKLLQSMEVSRTTLSFAPLSDDPTLALRRNPTPADLAQALDTQRIFPLDRLFNGTNVQESLAAVDEACEFIHLCLFGHPEKYRKAFLDFVSAQVARRPMDERAFQAAFGTDYGGMLLVLWNYNAQAKRTTYRLVGPDGKALPALPKLVTRKATDEELGKIPAVFRIGPPRP
jgi:hypothetical protein